MIKYNLPKFRKISKKNVNLFLALNNKRYFLKKE